MIKYLSVALLCSGMVFAAEKKSDTLILQPKLTQLSRYVTMIKNWKPDDCDKGKLSWQQKRAIGDENDVKALFALSHPKTGHKELWRSDQQEWVMDQYYVSSGGSDRLVQDTLHLSTDRATLGKVVGRHIAMHGLIDGRGIYTISAKPDSKRIDWHYTNGIGV